MRLRGSDSKIVIREQDPLKQGLKQEKDDRDNKSDGIREQDPLKQGLKLDNLALIALVK